MVVELQRDLREVGGVTTAAALLHPEVPLELAPGQVAGLSGIPGSGLTRIGLSLIAPYAASGHLAVLDVRGWVNPSAAWDLGIPADRFVVVRGGDVVSWGRIVAAMLTGLKGVYAEVPGGVRDSVLRNLAAKARAQRTPLVLRPIAGVLPNGLAHLRLDARSVDWEGVDGGHGALGGRRTRLLASGKAIRGREVLIEVEDYGASSIAPSGTHGLRVVPDVGAEATRRFA